MRINPKGDVGPVAALVIAVKPQTAPDALPLLAALIDAKTVVVSIMAGRTLGFLEKHLPDAAIVRAMPNTPAAIGRGITVAVGNAASQPRRASSRMACWPRPARSNGWTTRR